MNNKMIEKDEREKRIDSKRMGMAGGIGLVSMALGIIYKINDSYNEFSLMLDISIFVIILFTTVFYYLNLKLKENRNTGSSNEKFKIKFDERERHLFLHALSVSTVLIFMLTGISIF